MFFPFVHDNHGENRPLPSPVVLSKKYNVKQLRSLQRLIALRIIKGYRTISYEASCVVANIKPICIEVHEYCELYTLKRTGEYEKKLPLHLWNHPARDAIKVPLEETTFDMELFTDGSKMDEFVGGAYVAYLSSEEVATGGFKLNGACSNNQAEIIAIYSALEWLAEAAESFAVFPRNVVLYTDSMVAISLLEASRVDLDYVVRIRHLENILKAKEVFIHFSWIQAHVGHVGNERADSLAKAFARDINSSLIAVHPPWSSLVRQCKARSLDKWQEEWSSTANGSKTKEFFPTISSRRTLDLDLDAKLTMVLTGHGRHRAYLHRFKMIPSPNCNCDNSSIQDWQHLIFECTNLDRERMPLIRSVCSQGLNWPFQPTHLLKEEIIQEFLKMIKGIDLDLL